MFNNSKIQVHVYDVNGSHYALTSSHTQGIQPQSVDNEVFERLRKYGKRIVDYHDTSLTVIEQNPNHSARFNNLDSLGEAKLRRVKHLDAVVTRLLQSR